MLDWFGYNNGKKDTIITASIEKSEIILPSSNAQMNGKINNKKVAPTVKATSVNVIIDDHVHNEQQEDIKSASISLSIELNKKNSMTSIGNNRSYVQKPDNINTFVIQQQQQKPSNVSIMSNSSNSLLQRMASSPKATAFVYPTSVSANGSLYETQIEEDRSAALESLLLSNNILHSNKEQLEYNDIHQDNDHSNTNQLNNDNNTQQPEEATMVSTCENNLVSEQNQGAITEGEGFWSWLGFRSDKKEQSATSKNNEIIDVNNNNLVTMTTTTTTTTTITTSSTPSSPQQSAIENKSWTSYLFPSSKPTVSTTTTITTLENNIPKHDSSIDIASMTDNNEIRKVKSTTSLPEVTDITARAIAVKKTANTTQSLRLSSSASSLAAPKKKNIVLPAFQSQFTLVEPTSETRTGTASSNILTKAMDAINAILIQPPPDQPEDTSNWLAKKMRQKFSNFVQEIKSSALIDKRIVVVGVHGWFPMKLVRSMIGEPTGTSLKFCEQLALATKLYFQQEHGVTLPLNAITVVPLEGEGKVEDRVNQLYSRLIDNSTYLEAVSSADVILWATHSQGTPVSVMLLKRLLERGHIHLTRQSVCLLAMAGILHGPFPALKGSLIVKYFEADAARELFEFNDSSSPISTKFRQSLSYVLKCGLKVVLTGSMQDQVVPLYSAIMSSCSHPNILRSIYIDGHIYSQDDFLINLIVFALRLRNTGLGDHDLLVHLSEVLAGSLYALEGGHSTIYEELEVYVTAVKYTFETAPFGKYTRTTPQINRAPPVSRKTSISASSLLMTAITSTPPPIEEAKMDSFFAKQQQNPFYLPWVMHGICSDPAILADDTLKSDLKKLLDLFEEWNPTSAKLRELKFRLEPLKSIKLPS